MPNGFGWKPVDTPNGAEDPPFYTTFKVYILSD